MTITADRFLASVRFAKAFILAERITEENGRSIRQSADAGKIAQALDILGDAELRAVTHALAAIGTSNLRRFSKDRLLSRISLALKAQMPRPLVSGSKS